MPFKVYKAYHGTSLQYLQLTLLHKKEKKKEKKKREKITACVSNKDAILTALISITSSNAQLSSFKFVSSNQSELMYFTK
jgi:hypothetical protein